MNRSRILWSLAAITLMVSACATHPPRMKEEARKRWDTARSGIKLRLAQQAYDHRQFDEAVRAASEAIALDASQTKAYGILIRSNLELGRPATAQQALEAAKREGTNGAELIYLEGVILELQGGMESALAKYAEARELEPKKLDYLLAQAECLVELDRPEIAIGLLDANRQGLDDSGSAALLSAQIAVLMGDEEGAVRQYQEAMSLLGDNPRTAEELGLLLARLKRYDEAVAMLEPLLTGKTERAERGAVRRTLATSYLALHRAPEAAALLEEYTQANTEDVEAQLLLAYGAAQTGDWMTALRAVRSAEGSMPDDPDVRQMKEYVQRRRVADGNPHSPM